MIVEDDSGGAFGADTEADIRRTDSDNYVRYIAGLRSSFAAHAWIVRIFGSLLPSSAVTRFLLGGLQLIG